MTPFWLTYSVASRPDDVAKVWTASTAGEGAVARARDIATRGPHRAVPADGADRRAVGGKGSPWAVVLGIGGEAAADQASQLADPDQSSVALAPWDLRRVRLQENVAFSVIAPAAGAMIGRCRAAKPGSL